MKIVIKILKSNLKDAEAEHWETAWMYAEEKMPKKVKKRFDKVTADLDQLKNAIELLRLCAKKDLFNIYK